MAHPSLTYLYDNFSATWLWVVNKLLQFLIICLFICCLFRYILLYFIPIYILELDYYDLQHYILILLFKKLTNCYDAIRINQSLALLASHQFAIIVCVCAFALVICEEHNAQKNIYDRLLIPCSYFNEERYCLYFQFR